MREPFPQRTYLGRVLLTCPGPGMPGSSWNALVAFVPKASGTQVWASADLDESRLERVDTLPGAFSERACVEFLASDEGTACGGASRRRMRRA